MAGEGTAGVPDVVVVGAGQAGLAVGYFLRRAGLGFAILDAEDAPGGAWRHGWRSLRLFSPAQWSSLPGWPMPASPDGAYPSRDHAVGYLERPVRVRAVKHDGDRLRVEADDGRGRRARAVVSATGTWGKPFVPDHLGRDAFGGEQVHSASYTSPKRFARRTVLVVGGGNSAAQILAEVSEVAARVVWVTEREPRFLPDGVDGRVLFERATARYRALQEGRDPGTVPSLGDIVMVEPVRRARERGVLAGSLRPFERFTEAGVLWLDGTETDIDAVIWCTGFRPALDHLGGLGAVGPDGKVAVEGTRSVLEPRLWLVGYGEWTGYASATLVGVTRAARETVKQVAETLAHPG